MIVMLELINGLKLGIEHVTAEEQESDEFQWAVVVDILFLRLVFMKTL